MFIDVALSVKIVMFSVFENICFKPCRYLIVESKLSARANVSAPGTNRTKP